MYRTSGAMTFRGETDITVCVCVCVFISCVVHKTLAVGSGSTRYVLVRSVKVQWPLPPRPLKKSDACVVVLLAAHRQSKAATSRTEMILHFTASSAKPGSKERGRPLTVL